MQLLQKKEKGKNYMLKSYDPNISYGVHTVRFTLMQWDYVGHVAVKVNGNCKGITLLDPCFIIDVDEEDIKNFVENDCAYKVLDDYFHVELKNSSGDTLEIEDYYDELERMIVGIEIVDFKEKQND